MASSKKKPQTTLQPELQLGEHISCIGLRAHGVARDLPRTDLAADRNGTSHPLWPPAIRKGNYAADLSAGLSGYECASCGHLLILKRFYTEGRNHVAEDGTVTKRDELDAVCLVCRSTMDGIKLKAENRARRLERGVKVQRDQLERQQAKQIAKAAKRTDEERAAIRRRGRKKARMQVFREGAPEAQRELMARELCRRKYTAFVQRFEGMELVDDEEQERLKRSGKAFHMSWFHLFMCKKLQQFLDRILNDEQPCLLITTPPRHGKSTMTSRLFPPWVLGKFPELEIIAASYGSALPVEFSRFVRSLIREKAYENIFPHTRLAGDSASLKAWHTTKGGQYLPAGVGTGISGRGADIGIIDDPVKDQEEADSEAIQTRNIEWYLSVFSTRLSPRCGELLIQTRWSDNDLAGYLLRAMEEELKEHNEQFEGEREHIEANVEGPDRQRALDDLNVREADARGLIKQWEVVHFPAIATHDEYITQDLRLVHAPEEGAVHVRRPGDALHPERYNDRRLHRMRRVMQRTGKTRLWHALYQGDPAPDTGEYFTKDMFPEEAPLEPHQFSHWTILQAWDPAIGQKQTNDYTVGGTGALDPWGRLHVLHMQRLRGGPAELAKAMVAEYAFYEDCCARGVYRLGLEHGAISLALEDSLEHALDELNKERVRAGKTKLHRPHYMEGEEALKPVTDKLVRSRPSQGWHRSGRVLYPKGAAWVEQHHREHYRFMTGYQWDDCVDFTSWLVRVASKAPLPRHVQATPQRTYGKYQSLRKRLAAKQREQRGARRGYMSA